MTEAHEPRSATPEPPPRRGAEVYAAVIASLIGLLALAVSGYTAYLQRRQLRAQVWPHLQIEYSTVNANFVVLNQGTGPARVVALRVTCGGTVIKSWDDAEKRAGFTGEEGVVRTTLHHAVLPADKTVALVQARDDAASRKRFADFYPGRPHEVDLSVCYCSVLDECWFATTNADEQRIDTCPIPDAERFKE